MASQEVSTDMINLNVGSSPVAVLLGTMTDMMCNADEWKLLMPQENCKGCCAPKVYEGMFAKTEGCVAEG